MDELSAMDMTPEFALWDGLYSSKPHVFTIHVDCIPSAMFGVSDYDENIGAVWMLGTEVLKEVPIGLVVESREWVNYLNELYPVLTNYVDIRNTAAINWLEALGFFFSDVDFFETPQTTFRRFIRCVQQRQEPQ